jgi:hypothetical protein
MSKIQERLVVRVFLRLFAVAVCCGFGYGLGQWNIQRHFPLASYVQEVATTCYIVDSLRAARDSEALQAGCMQINQQIKQLEMIWLYAPRRSDREAAFMQLKEVSRKRSSYEVLSTSSKEAQEVRRILETVGGRSGAGSRAKDVQVGN